MALGTSNGLPIGGGAPPTQRVSCSLGSGLLFFSLRYAKTAAVPWDATPEQFALALENLGVAGAVNVRALPALQPGGGYAPAPALCSGAPGAPAVIEVAFPSLGGAVPALALSAAQQTAWEPGEASVAVVAAGSLPSYGADALAPRAWGADMLHGCHCDGYPDWNSTRAGATDRGAWLAPTCALRACASGVVPLSAGGVRAAAQTLACAAEGGSFTLAFKGQVSAPLDFDASAAEVAAALEALPSIGRVAVGAPAAAGAGACGGGAAGAAENSLAITVRTALGAQPLLVADGAFLLGAGASVRVLPLVEGAGEVAECSGHGVCDRAAGLCTCLPSYASSDGAGGVGARGDCGVSVSR